MITIDAVTTAFPERTVTVEQRCAELGWSPTQAQAFRRIGGLARVHHDPEVPLETLLLEVTESALAGVDRARVRYLIYGHAIHGRGGSSPELAGWLRERLGLAADTSAVALSQQNCAIPLSAIDVARTALLADPDPDACALIVTGEKLPARVARQINTVILGDGAAAALLTVDGPGTEVCAFATRTEGRFYDGLHGSRADFRAAAELRPGALRTIMHEALAGSGYTPDDVQVIVPPNQGRAFWDGVLDERAHQRLFFDNNAEYGHCLAADVLINYATLHDSGRLTPGRPVLWVATGLGWTFSSLLVVPRSVPGSRR